MAKKATINPVTDTVNNAAAINTQLNAINDKLDNTLSLDGSLPNAMGADLDLNSNDILNVKNIYASDIVVAGNSVAASAAASAASAADAAISADAAQTAQTAAEAALDSFDDIYLGPKASEPTLDNDGDALVVGALYYNTTLEKLYIYSGSVWQVTAGAAAGDLQSTNNLSDLTNFVTARANLGLAIGTDVQAYSTVLANTTASFTVADESKLDNIEVGATADQTKLDIDALGVDAGTLDGIDSTGFALVGHNHTGVYEPADATILKDADIGVTVQAYDANLVSDATYVHTDNNYTTTEKNKLAGIETGATTDQTGAEIKSLYEAELNTNAYTDAEKTKLAGIEALADVTDTTNVTAAGALMDSELTSIASIKALNQGVATTDSPTFVKVTAGDMDISGPTPLLTLTDTDSTNRYTTIQNAGGGTYIDSRNDTLNGITVFRGIGGGVPDEYARFDASGNFGIGTNSPSAALDVVGNAEINGNLTVDTSTLHVDSTNNRVGIGTVTPSERLDVGNGVARFPNNITPAVENDGAAYFGKIGNIAAVSGSAGVAFRQSGTELGRINSTGLGIGTTSPSAKLDVVGNAEINGDIAVTGTVDGRDVAVDGTKLDGLSADANVSLMFKRKLAYALPWTTTQARTFATAAGAIAMYPQGFNFDPSADIIYVIYSPSGGTITSFNTIVVAWDVSDPLVPVELSTFALATGSSREYLIPFSIGASKYLLAGGSTNPKRFNITTLPTTGTTVAAEATYTSISNYNHAAYDGRSFLFTTGLTDAGTGAGSKRQIHVWNDDLTAKVGEYGLPSSLASSFTNPLLTASLKSQAFCWHSGKIWFGMGGLFLNGTTSGEDDSSNQGIATFDPVGNAAQAYVAPGALARLRFADCFGISAASMPVIENEGIATKGGKVYTLWTTRDSSTFGIAAALVSGIYITQEASTAVDSTDFSDIAALPRASGFDAQEASYYGWTPTSAGVLEHPLTGATLGTVQSILDAMVDCGMTQSRTYTSGITTPITDPDGASIASGTMILAHQMRDFGCEVEVRGLASYKRWWYAGGVFYKDDLTRDGSGNLDLNANMEISGGTPTIDIVETDAVSADTTRLVLASNNFRIQTVNNGTYIAEDYSLDRNATGATAHRWMLQNSQKMRLDATSLKVNTTNDAPGVANTATGVSLRADTAQCVSGSNIGMYLNSNTVGGINLSIRNNGTFRGSITSDGTQASFNTTSDARLKDDLKTFDGLEAIMALDMYDFAWKSDGTRGRGVMAQEAYETAPYAVSVGGEDAVEEPWSVDYSKFVPDLIRAMQQQQATIEDLTARIAELEVV